MRKQTKVVAVASAAALLAIGASMTSFAATGWVEEDGTWYYYDSDENRVEDEWKKSGDNWYWLDSEENGAMAVDKLIEDDDDTYYVDSNGVMVTNTWVKVVNEDQDDDDDPAEYHYYYMQSNGKAYKGNGDNVSKKTIDGKRYAFDEDGKMLYGWVTDDGDLANGEDEWKDAVYYFGSWEDGSMKTGWQQISVFDDEGEKDDDYNYWFNFKSNGKKRTHETDDDTWHSNGRYYHFDTRGVMVYQWVQTSGSNTASASSWSYFNSPEDDAKVVKGWFKVVPPTEDNTFDESELTFASEDSDDEEERWYYSDGNDDGLVVGEIKKIKGKYYGFWPDDGEKGGRMLIGLNALTMDPENGEIIDSVYMDDMDSDDLDDFMDQVDAGTVPANTYLYYFGDDLDSDGAMKDGNVTINLDGDNYTFKFRESGGADSRGRSVTGIDDGDYIYKYGQRMKADSDEKYILVYADGDINDDDVTVYDFEGSDVRRMDGILNRVDMGISDAGDDGKTKVYYGFTPDETASGELYWYLVNTSGRIQSGKKSGLKDGDDYYWYMNDDKVIMYTDSKDLGDTNRKVDGVDRNLKDDWDEVASSADIVDLLD
ncbi:MAG TPA: cell wall-binding protein [Candidatus Ventrimonas merdavium]|nr:cell wall-binding protein [Candidatus Ventrimonas merdavium]